VVTVIGECVIKIGIFLLIEHSFLAVGQTTTIIGRRTRIYMM